jgi:hypothetical protein
VLDRGYKFVRIIEPTVNPPQQMGYGCVVPVLPVGQLVLKGRFCSNRTVRRSRRRRSSAGIKSFPAADLWTYPSASNRAPAAASLEPTTVKNKIFVVGEIRRISSAACIPFIWAILMSSRTTSGLKALTCSIASLPSLASPQTCTHAIPKGPGWSFEQAGNHQLLRFQPILTPA